MIQVFHVLRKTGRKGPQPIVAAAVTAGDAKGIIEILQSENPTEVFVIGDNSTIAMTVDEFRSRRIAERERQARLVQVMDKLTPEERELLGIQPVK